MDIIEKSDLIQALYNVQLIGSINGVSWSNEGFNNANMQIWATDIFRFY